MAFARTALRALNASSLGAGVAVSTAAASAAIMLTQEQTPARSAGSLLSQLTEISAKVSTIEKTLGCSEEKPEVFLFTSESVNEGHPDKLADQVSDAVVDACFAGDAESHVACETCTGTNFAMIFGEITTNSKFDYESVVRNTIKECVCDGERHSAY